MATVRAEIMNEAAVMIHDAERLLELVHGFRVSQAIYAMVSLGVADALADRLVNCHELAEQTKIHPRALYRVLRALAAAGLVREEQGEMFSLTRTGSYLRSDVPGSRAAWVRNAMLPEMWQAWQSLPYTVRTGKPAFEHTHGKDVWRFRSDSPDNSAIFDLAMREGTLRVAADLLSHYDFAQFRHIVDVGGGDGSLLAALLAGCSGTSGTLFDQSHVVAGAHDVVRRAGVESRCNIVAGSFFESVPADANAYILKFILHDWDDGNCVKILANCRRAMASDARLLIIERLLAPPNEGLDGKLSDLNMMVNLGGQERTLVEFSSIFQSTGLELRDVYELPGQLALLEVMQ